MLVYDITNEESFEQVKNYYSKEIKQNCKENVIVVLLGNKSDLENYRKIKPEIAANFAVKQGYIFMETSCEKNKNVADAFTTLIENANIRMKKNEESNTKRKKNKQLNAGMDNNGRLNTSIEKNEKLNIGLEKDAKLNTSTEKNEDGNRFKIGAKSIKKKKKKCPCWRS